MTNKYQEKLYESMKDAALFKGKGKSNAKKDILQMEKGNTYLVRLIADVDDPEKSWLQTYSHGWISVDTGKFVGTGCPKTYDEPCPICKTYLEMYNKDGSEEAKEKCKLIKRKTKTLVNVYVVDDPVNPENNGTVKVLQYGQQLEAIIKSAWEGEDKDDIGIRMFDFSENGCNLRIKVELNQGGFLNYSSSKFLNPSRLNVNVDEIMNQKHDLHSFVKIRTKDELQKMLDVDFFGDKSASDDEEVSVASSKTKATQADDEIPMTFGATNTTGVDADVMAELDKLNSGN